jgi:hypothetical protein
MGRANHATKQLRLYHSLHAIVAYVKTACLGKEQKKMSLQLIFHRNIFELL